MGFNHFSKILKRLEPLPFQRGLPVIELAIEREVPPMGQQSQGVPHRLEIKNDKIEKGVKR